MNKNKALIILITAAILFFLTYPLKWSFIGGLLVSAFSAAMIGGLADWYAVTALFKKPLGIPFRTAVIPNNKDRIFSAIVDMIEKDLLTSENIKFVLNKVDLTNLILNQLNSPTTKHRLKEITSILVIKLINIINIEKIANTTNKLFYKNIVSANKFISLKGALAWSIKNGFLDDAINIVLHECQNLAKSSYIKDIIINIYFETKKAYIGESLRRNFLYHVIEEVLELTPEIIAEKAQEKLEEYLSDSNPAYLENRERIKQYLISLADDLDSLQNKDLEDIKEAFLVNLNFENILNEIFSDFKNIVNANPDQVETFISKVGRQIYDFIIENPEEEQKINELILNTITRLVNKHHQVIGNTVSHYLNSLSTEELVKYIELKAGNDLQMIRINGSLVGSIVGMILYLVTYFLGVV